MVEPSAEVGVFGHGYTYSGHPVGCAVALKVLEIYQRDRIFEHAARVGDYLQRRMDELQDHPLVGEVRGAGMIAAAELVANKATGQAFESGAVGAYATGQCQQRGLIVRAVAGSSLALCPPLILTEAQVDEMMDKLGAALDQTLDYVRKQGLLRA
jgi:adenosylmethionine-8-amino-7-oxononanoate aminotransferase